MVGTMLSGAAPAIAAVPQIDQSMVITCANAQGTGFFIEGNLAITAKHVIKGCKSVDITDNAKHKATGKVVFVSSTDDIAIVSVSGITAPKKILPIDLSQVKKSESIEIVGTPIDGLVLSQGTIAAVSDSYTPRSIVLNVPADHGNSGGPVFSSTGVIGVVIELTSLGQVVALNAGVIQSALESYKSGELKPQNAPSVSPTPQSSMIVIDSSAPKLQISLVVNGVLALVILGLILSRRKRFSRRRIVINLSDSKQPVAENEMEKK